MPDKIIIEEISGLGLPAYQLVVIGPTPALKELKYDTLQSKLGNAISEEMFKIALEKLTDGILNVYMDSFQMIGLSTKYSRHNSPSQTLTIGRHMKALAGKAKGDLCIVAVIESKNALATVCAIGRAFSLYSTKTKNQSERTVRIEILSTVEESSKLTEGDIRFLNDVVHATRNAARLVDAPCCVLNTSAFVEEARAVAADLGFIQKTCYRKRKFLKTPASLA